MAHFGGAGIGRGFRRRRRRWLGNFAPRPFATEVLNLAKTCSIGLRSGEYFGKKTKASPGDIADRSSHGLSLVGAEIVEDHDVAWLPQRVGTRNCST